MGVGLLPGRARHEPVLGLPLAALTSVAAGLLQMIPFFGPFVSWAPPVVVALVLQPDAVVPAIILMGAGWLVVMNVLQPRIMQGAVGIHPIVVLGSVLIGGRIAGIPGAIFGIPIAAVVSAFVLEFLHRTSGDRTVAGRAARRLEERDGRPVRIPREPTPGSATDIDEPAARRAPPSRRRSRRILDREPTMSDRGAMPPDMTRERARTERRDLDKERGEPLAGGAARGGPRALRKTRGPLGEWTTPAADPGHQRRRRRVARAARAQAGARGDGRGDGRRARHEPERGRPPEDADAPAARARADAGRRLARLLGRRLADRRGQPRLPRLLRARLRPRRRRHQLRREPRRRHHLLGHGQRGDGGGHQQLPGVRDLAGVLRASRFRRWPAGRRRRSPGTSSSTACRRAS